MNDATRTIINGYFSLEFNIINIFRCRNDFLRFNHTNPHVYTTRCRAINNMKIVTVKFWRPRCARPVPYKCLQAFFRRSFPQSFSFTKIRIKCIYQFIQSFMALVPIAGNPMNIRTTASCKCCPHWWGNSRHATQHMQIFPASTTINQSLYIRHFPFINQATCGIRVHTINSQEKYFFSSCLFHYYSLLYY